MVDVTDCTLVTSAHEGRRFISANVPWHPTNRTGWGRSWIVSSRIVWLLTSKCSTELDDSQSILRDDILLQLSWPPQTYFLLFVVFRNHLAKGQVTRAHFLLFVVFKTILKRVRLPEHALTNSLRIYTFKLQIQWVQNGQFTQRQTQASETDYNKVIKHMPKLKWSITRWSNAATITDIAGIHPKRRDYMYK
jgi:hypothetical protein